MGRFTTHADSLVRHDAAYCDWRGMRGSTDQVPGERASEMHIKEIGGGEEREACEVGMGWDMREI